MHGSGRCHFRADGDRKVSNGRVHRLGSRQEYEALGHDHVRESIHHEIPTDVEHNAMYSPTYHHSKQTLKTAPNRFPCIPNGITILWADFFHIKSIAMKGTDSPSDWNWKNGHECVKFSGSSELLPAALPRLCLCTDLRRLLAIAGIEHR